MDIQAPTLRVKWKLFNTDLRLPSSFPYLAVCPWIYTPATLSTLADLNANQGHLYNRRHHFSTSILLVSGLDPLDPLLSMQQTIQAVSRASFLPRAMQIIHAIRYSPSPQGTRAYRLLVPTERDRVMHRSWGATSMVWPIPVEINDAETPLHLKQRRPSLPDGK